MSVRKIFEAELDGRSVIVWEAGVGTRILYPTDKMAETAADWLIDCANRFHTAKEKNDGMEDEHMVSVILYGDRAITEFVFVREYLDRIRKFGFEIQEGLSRSPRETW